MAVVDASVYVALIHRHEEGHEASWAWLRQALQAEEAITAPTLLVAEVAAALGRGLGDPELAHRAVEQILSRNVVELAPVSISLATRAGLIAADARLRGSDAVYVALAEQLDDELVTLDRQQLERGAALVPTRRPERGPQ